MRSTTFDLDKELSSDFLSFPQSAGNPHPAQTTEPVEYFVGDIYDRYDALGDGRWPSDQPDDGPYVRKVKYLARNGWPSLRYLADWLDVSTVPIKAKVIVPEDRAERLTRCHVSVVDFNHCDEPVIREFTSGEALTQSLDLNVWEDVKGNLRLFIVEDLSTSVVELLGHRFNLDPTFFRSHLGDYSWYNIRDPWVEVPTLPSRAQASPHFSFRYLRPHYFRNSKSAETAKRHVGMYNVLRRIDMDRFGSWADKPGSCVGSVRSNISCYIRSNEETGLGWLGFLLVDPPVHEGYPLWSGYDNIRPPPTYSDAEELSPHLFGSPMEDIIYWIKTMPPHEQQIVRTDNDYILSPLFCYVPAQWLLSFEHITNRLSLIEWEVERKEHRTAQSLDNALSRLHPWRRNVVNFGYRIRASIDTVKRFRRCRKSSEHEDEWSGLLANFQDLEKRYKVLEAKIDKIMSVLTAVMTIEETKKQMRNARDVARISYLAFIYVPTAFVTSFLSMDTSFPDGSNTVYWTFFVIAVPLTAFSLALAIYWTRLIQLFKDNLMKKPPPDAGMSIGKTVK